MSALNQILHPHHVSLIRQHFTLPSLFHAFADRVDPYFEYDGLAPARGINAPRFNVTETESKYILDGELPGVSEKHSVVVRWLRNQVLLVSGEMKPSDTEAAVDPFETGTTKNEVPAAKEHETVVPDRHKIEVQAMTEKPQVTYPRHLLRERALGPFQRSFTFPDEVDVDGMKASLNDGLLRVVVPKLNNANQDKRIHVE